MHDVLVNFIKGVKDKQHLMDLLSDSLIKICIRTEKSNALLLVGKGDLILIDSDDQEMTDVEIQGGEDVITSVLQGKIKLREAVKRGNLNVTASFRMTLYLETLFILGKSY